MGRLELLADGRIRKLLALLMMMAMLILLWVGLFQPIIALLRGDSPLVLTTRLLAEQRRIVERQPQLLTQRTALLQAGPDRSAFLSGASPALAAAELQSQLGATVQKLGGSVSSVEALPFADEEGFHRAGLRLKLSLRQEALPTLLRTIESGRPSLLISALSLKSNGEGEVTATLDLFGYLAAETP